MQVTREQADETVAWVWPTFVEQVARAAGLVHHRPGDYRASFGAAVVLTLAANDGRIADAWVADHLTRYATEVVPGLLGDLREARHMADALTVETFGAHLASAWRWPAGPVRVLQALCVLRPEFAPVVEARAAHLGRPDPLRLHQPTHVTAELLEDHAP